MAGMAGKARMATVVAKSGRMRGWRRVVAALTGGALAVVGLTAAAPGAPRGPDGADEPTAQADPPGESWQVTLITGDTVRVTRTPDGYSAEPEPATGREDIVFGIRQLDGEISVYPHDAVPLIMSGQVDRRLFEVTSLVEDGYHDAELSELPLIVQADTFGELRAASVERRLTSIDASAVRTPKAQAAAFWRSFLALESSGASARAGTPEPTVWLDAKVRADLDESVGAIGAPAVWEHGSTGEGVRVAVLDSGIDRDHLDLAGQVVAEQNFTWTETTDDALGHGTHVASIIAGTGAASDGRYTGVAPDAELLNGKVLDDFGWGWSSDIIAGMEWAIEQDARVVNMSLGGGGDGYGTDPMSLAVNRLTESSGALFVVAAGNDGEFGERTISAPGDADRALTVAATDRDGGTAEFSSRGPRYFDHALKPDIAAPGVGIAAARADGTEAGDPIDANYTRLSGTSMSAPHVAGAAALLAGIRPKAAPRELKASLMGSADESPAASVFEQGAGFLDIERAVDQRVVATKGSLSAFLDWPHTEPEVRKVTYRNSGNRPVPLRLSFTPTDDDGDAAPRGLFRLPRTVWIPAGETRSVPLRIDPRRGEHGTGYQGTIVATGRDVTVRTPVAAHVEAEMYDVTFEYINRDGEPITATGDGNFAELPIIVDRDSGEATPLRADDGELVARVPAGTYTVAENILTWEGDEPTSATLVADPEIVVTDDTTVRLDARDAQPVRFTGDVAGATTNFRLMSLFQGIGGDDTFVTQLRDRSGQIEAFVLGTEAVPDRTYWFSDYVQLEDADGRLYSLVEGERGRLPADPTYPIDAETLADLAVDLGLPSDGPMTGLWGIGGYVQVDGIWLPLLDAGPEVDLPARLQVSVTPEAFGADVLWGGRLETYDWSDSWPQKYDEHLPDRTYRAGEQESLRFSFAPWRGAASGTHYGDGELSIRTCPICSAYSDDLSPIVEDPPVGRIEVWRDGESIMTRDSTTGAYIEDATEPATYTVELFASHEYDWLPYARDVEARWTFASGPSPDGEDVKVASILDARVTGPFDLHGRAAPGTELPLTIEIGGGDQETIATPSLSISYDDGDTWRDLDVRKVDGQWVAVETTPATGQVYASLRVQASDGAGNAVDITTHRAFKVESASSS